MTRARWIIAHWALVCVDRLIIHDDDDDDLLIFHHLPPVIFRHASHNQAIRPLPSITRIMMRCCLHQSHLPFSATNDPVFVFAIVMIPFFLL